MLILLNKRTENDFIKILLGNTTQLTLSILASEGVSRVTEPE